MQLIDSLMLRKVARLMPFGVSESKHLTGDDEGALYFVRHDRFDSFHRMEVWNPLTSVSDAMEVVMHLGMDLEFSDDKSSLSLSATRNQDIAPTTVWAKDTGPATTTTISEASLCRGIVIEAEKVFDENITKLRKGEYR